MPSTKRPRSTADENRAECPYTVRTRLPTQQESRQHFSKKRKSEGPDEERKTEWHWQNSPFNPSGKFKTNETVDVKYAVDPHQSWQAMTRYSSFVCECYLSSFRVARGAHAMAPAYTNGAPVASCSGQGEIPHRRLRLCRQRGECQAATERRRHRAPKAADRRLGRADCRDSGAQRAECLCSRILDVLAR